MNQPGGGYNIPISASLADSFSAPQTITAPTYFVFSSAGAKTGGDIEATAESTNPTTATSSAALGDAASKTDVGQSGGENKDGISTTTAVLIGSGILAVAIITAIIIYKRK